MAAMATMLPACGLPAHFSSSPRKQKLANRVCTNGAASLRHRGHRPARGEEDDDVHDDDDDADAPDCLHRRAEERGPLHGVYGAPLP